MMNAKETAKAIRTALKAAGITSKEVSVRSSVYSMGSSVHVSIKTASVTVSAVEAIALPFQRVARCEVTGDILGGGNLYVEVSHAGGIASEIAETLVGPITEALEADGYAFIDGIQIANRGQYDIELIDIAASTVLRSVCNAREAAFVIARRQLA